MEQVVVHDHDEKGDKEVYERLDHQNQEEYRICKLCGKRFHSAKALGGHLRVHYEVNNSRNSNNKISCYVCKKSYPSLKSLYGHMSSHRERDWRGIRPPPPPAPARNQNTNSDHVKDNSCSNDNDLKSDIDVAKFLVRFANGNDRRGRKRSSLIANKQTVPNYAETSSTTTSLAYRVNHLSFKKLKFFDARTNKTMEANRTSSTGKVDQTSAWKTMKPTILKIGTTRPMRDNLALVLDQTHHHNKLQIQRKPQKFVSLNIDDHESGFSTKHGPKGKLVYHGINNGSYRSSTQVDRADEEEARGGHYIKQFECNICRKKFPSGQALGGHKRFHSYKKGPVEAPETREFVASPLIAALPEEASDDGAREVLDFDLNELPFESSEDEGMSNSVRAAA